MSGVLVMAVGLNPERILRVAEARDPRVILALTNPETEHLLPEVGAALRHLGSGARLTSVPGDGYRFDLNIEALRNAAARLVDEDPRSVDTWDWVISGGTKPMIAAEIAAAAEVPHGVVWSLDDRAGELVGAERPAQPVPEPVKNLPPDMLARLHAGLDAQTDPDRGIHPDRERGLRRVRWLLERLNAPGHILHRESSQEVGYRAERAVVTLLRAVVPADRDVYGNVTVPLRDPSVPTTPAMELLGGRRAPRRFEVDGLVIRGTQAWVVENKFANLRQQEARIAAAELDTRRRHLGGDIAVGVLIMLDDAVGQRFDDHPPVFELGGVRVVTRRALIEATEVVLAADEVSETELAGVFQARWGGPRA